MDDLNDFGFSTVSETDFTAATKEPETKVVEAAVKEAKAGQIKEVEGTVNKIWSLLDYHYEDIDKHKENNQYFEMWTYAKDINPVHLYFRNGMLIRIENKNIK